MDDKDSAHRLQKALRDASEERLERLAEALANSPRFRRILAKKILADRILDSAKYTN